MAKPMNRNDDTKLPDGHMYSGSPQLGVCGDFLGADTGLNHVD